MHEFLVKASDLGTSNNLTFKPPISSLLVLAVTNERFVHDQSG